MSALGTGYDWSASQFSPDGRIFQVEYAAKAVENSGTVIALKCKDGVVVASENILTSRLYEPNSFSRMFKIERHIGLVASGFLSDAREIAQIARDEATDMRKWTGETVSLKMLSDRVSMYMHAYTLYGMVRPFGCSVMLVSCGADGAHPEIYAVEPSGTCYGYEGCAAGKAQQSAKTEIEKIKLSEIDIRSLVKEAAKIIYKVHDEVKDRLFELELGWVCKESDFKFERVPENVLREAVEFAEAAIREDDEDD